MFAEMVRAQSGRRNATLFCLLCAALLFVIGCIPASYEGGAGTEDPINDVQYLESYGEWFEIPPYGFVWHPFVVSDWAPFSHGHWMWTNDGWAWVSYEPFGWLVYHYGFWDYRRDLGWFWIPGDAWSPARVEWYSYGDYCAWAPIPPPDVYWPPPWEPYDTEVWIIVETDQFTDDNVGRRRITTRYPRELARRENIGKAPDIRIIRERENRIMNPVIIRKEPAEIRIRPFPEQPRSTAPRDSSIERAGDSGLERMVLPRSDQRKVERYSPDVRREILAPRKPSPPPEQKPAERMSDSARTKTLKRR